jgi:hypothetical protein
MRYIVKVECLSSVVLAKLKKSSRILHIFSLIDNTIALETEDIGYIKGLKEVRQVYESGKAKLMLTDALNRIGIFDVQNQKLPVDDPKVRRRDISRAKDVLGREPVVGLGDGLENTVEYFEKLYMRMS